MNIKEKNKKQKSKSPKKDNSPKNKKSSLAKNSPQENTNRFPKNVNEFRHIMDDVNCCVPDIEYMLQLRRHKKMANLKNVPANSPSFYDEDLNKYKTKLAKRYDDKQLLQTNIGNFRQLFGDRTRYAINNIQYKFEVTLRREALKNQKSINKDNDTNNQNSKEKIIKKNKFRWDPTTIPRSKSLFDTILPPVLSRSKEIFGRLEDKIGRPVIQVNKEGFINGEKVRRRVFDYNRNLALRYPSEHNPSSKYVNDYGTQNIGSIKHLLNYDNKTMMSSWSTYLRGPKKIKFSMEETKRREKRLRDKSNEKSYPKN